MTNEAKLRGAMAYIKINPEEWNQGDFSCGTSACLAGTAVLVENDFDQAKLYDWWNSSSHAIIEYEAQDILELNEFERNQLFWAYAYCDAHDSMVVMGYCKGNWCGRSAHHRHPTYDEYEAHVTKVTGVKFKDGERD